MNQLFPYSKLFNIFSYVNENYPSQNVSFTLTMVAAIIVNTSEGNLSLKNLLCLPPHISLNEFTSQYKYYMSFIDENGNTLTINDYQIKSLLLQHVPSTLYIRSIGMNDMELLTVEMENGFSNDTVKMPAIEKMTPPAPPPSEITPSEEAFKLATMSEQAKRDIIDIGKKQKKRVLNSIETQSEVFKLF